MALHPSQHRSGTVARMLVRGANVLALGLCALLGACSVDTPLSENRAILPAPQLDASAKSDQETVVFAGGCFWGVQAVFQHTKGVLNAVSGYAGGAADKATYHQVSTGYTGHAESVQVTFDPHQVSYGKLLQIYFSVAHDPTQLDQQYPDSGSQYRSAIFFTNHDQETVARAYIAQLEAAHAFSNKIVTQLNPLTAFYPAENYHQNYATEHPGSAYIARYDTPKVAHLKSALPELYREVPVLVGAATLANAGTQAQ